MKTEIKVAIIGAVALILSTIIAGTLGIMQRESTPKVPSKTPHSYFNSTNETILIQVIIDNSGVIHDEADPSKKRTFDQFTKTFLNILSERYKNEQQAVTIWILSAVDPSRTIWKGSASDFFLSGMNSSEIKELFISKTGCNSIVTSLNDALINTKIQKAGRNVLYVITSGVHSGPHCEKLTQEMYVELLTQLDKDMVEKINKVSEQFDLVSFQFLTAAQRRLFFEYFKEKKIRKKLISQGEPPAIYN